MVTLKFKLPCILAAITLISAAEIKGVDPAKYDLYNPSIENTWTCLDGSKSIPYSAINDDYCDCADGSDEPGTSACPNTFFYCANIEHIPAYIKSYAVNDGVCDEACCDGSDENGSLVTCPNRCQQVGEAYRKEQSSIQKSTKAGLTAKNKLIEDAEKQVELWEEQQTKLEDEIILKKSDLLKLQRELKDLESQSSNLKHKNKFKCQSGVFEVATLKHDIVILQKELNTLKTILGDMKRDHNHNYHDMAVKSAISGYDEFLTRFETIKTEIDDHLANINVEEAEQDEQDEDWDIMDDTEEVDSNMQDPIDEGKKEKHSIADIVLVKLESILPAYLKSNVLDKLLPLVKRSNISANKSHHDGSISSKTAIENARKLYQDAESEINKLSSELEQIKNDLAVDYGVDKEWLKLKDVCIEKDEGEYTYSLCFLGDAYQKSNKDSTRTFLGKFENFDGLDNDLYKIHSHTHGTRCWNGPERSVRAKIECGSNNEILEVSEPEKCEYHFRMVSPAVCQSSSQAEHETTVKSLKPTHEEL